MKALALKSVQFIWTNLDTTLAIIISVVAAIFGIFGSNQAYTLAAVATSLGILAFSIIRDRASRDKLIEETKNVHLAINRLESIRQNSDTFFSTRKELPSFRYRLQDIRSLDMIGSSLLSTSVSSHGAIHDFKVSGGKVRLLISNPNNRPLQALYGMTFLEAGGEEKHRRQVLTALNNLSSLVGTHSSGGSVEIRVSEHFLPFSYVGMDVGSSRGQIQIEYYLKKLALDKNPVFLLSFEKDTHWYNEYKRQFEILWNEGAELKHLSYQNNSSSPSAG